MAEVSHGCTVQLVESRCVYIGVRDTCALPTRSVHVRVAIATGRCFSHKVLCAMGERTNDTEPAARLLAMSVIQSRSTCYSGAVQTRQRDKMRWCMLAGSGARVRRPATLKCLRAVCRIMATDLRFRRLLSRPMRNRQTTHPLEGERLIANIKRNYSSFVNFSDLNLFNSADQ